MTVSVPLAETQDEFVQTEKLNMLVSPGEPVIVNNPELISYEPVTPAGRLEVKTSGGVPEIW